MPTVAQTLGRAFAAWGCRYVFGLPGGETLDLMEGLRQEGLEFILTRHETAAAIMAATVGDLTGVPGLCLSTLGPGATNMVTGVAQALLDRSPLVAMSAQIPAARQSILTHQMLDLGALYRPVTKWTAEVNAANAARTARKALHLTCDGRRGPVHLAIPSDVARQEAVTEPVPFPSGPPATLAPAAFPDLGAVRELISAARHPVLIVGTGALDAPVAALRFAEWLGCPVYDLPKAKGSFPEDHPQFVGTLEMAGAQTLFAQLRAADLILAFGADPVEYDHWWDFPAKVITFDSQPNTLHHTPSHADVVGPLAEAVAALTDGTTRTAADTAALRTELEAALASEAVPRRLHPRQVIAALRAALPRESILATDTGAHKMAAGQLWHTSTPRTYLLSNGLSTMGYAIPAAIAARLARPEQPVTALVGDGGFMMSVAELETAARLGLRLLVVVMDDGALGSIRLNQRRRGYPSQGVAFGRPDYPSLARALGGQGWEVDAPADLPRILGEACAAPGVAVVAARIDGDAYRL